MIKIGFIIIVIIVVAKLINIDGASSKGFTWMDRRNIDICVLGDDLLSHSYYFDTFLLWYAKIYNKHDDNSMWNIFEDQGYNLIRWIMPLIVKVFVEYIYIEYDIYLV